MAEKKIVVKTGEKVPVSGQYRPSGTNKEYTFVKGKEVPPNVYGGKHKFTLVDQSKHKK